MPVALTPQPEAAPAAPQPESSTAEIYFFVTPDRRALLEIRDLQLGGRRATITLSAAQLVEITVAAQRCLVATTTLGEIGTAAEVLAKHYGMASGVAHAVAEQLVGAVLLAKSPIATARL